jgi:CheY-like chemotaxis protein
VNVARILVIDDDANNRLLLRTLLLYAGHTVLEAASGKQGADIAFTEMPDLIVVDLSLPDISGAELIKRFRSDSKTTGIRLALYTATNMNAAIEELTETFNVAGVIPKPGEPQAILDAFDRILNPK